MLFQTFLILHIIGGSLGLITGTMNLVRKKGGKNHVLTGKIFTCGMLTAGFCSLVLAYIHPNYFLFITGVFTLYLTATGNRYIYMKMLGKGGIVPMADRLITYAMLLASLLFIAEGIRLLISGNTFGIVLIVFAIIAGRFVRVDLRNYKGEVKLANYWLLAHLQRMTGAYIAALTAFLVVNGNYCLPPSLPSFIPWLFPTAILVPLIVKWSRKYAVKLKTIDTSR